MKMNLCIVFFVFAASVISGSAQSDPSLPKATPARLIVTNTMPPTQPIRTMTSAPLPAKTPNVVGQNPPTAASDASNINYSGLSFSQIKSKIAEAKREMQVRPITTSMTEPATNSTVPSQVRIAFYNWRDKKIDYIVIGKDAFLTTNESTFAMSANGHSMTTRTIRANGVNTPLAITDERGQAQLPLMIQYPVERGGRYMETA